MEHINGTSVHPASWICILLCTYMHTNLCVYIYTHANIYVYTYIHTHTHTYIHTQKGVRKRFKPWKMPERLFSVHTHTCIYEYLHAHTHTHTITHTHTHICTYTHTHIHTHTHTHTHKYIHTQEWVREKVRGMEAAREAVWETVSSFRPVYSTVCKNLTNFATVFQPESFTSTYVHFSSFALFFRSHPFTPVYSTVSNQPIMRCFYLFGMFCFTLWLFSLPVAVTCIRMYVCMYVCMHVCMYACMHACLWPQHAIQPRKSRLQTGHS
jgi:hypothetical protein